MPLVSMHGQREVVDAAESERRHFELAGIGLRVLLEIGPGLEATVLRHEDEGGALDHHCHRRDVVHASSGLLAGEQGVAVGDIDRHRVAVGRSGQELRHAGAAGAPATLTTGMPWPTIGSISLLTRRASWSAPPPGPHGTINSIGRSGYSARAGAAPKDAAAATNEHSPTVRRIERMSSSLARHRSGRADRAVCRRLVRRFMSPRQIGQADRRWCWSRRMGPKFS